MYCFSNPETGFVFYILNRLAGHFCNVIWVDATNIRKNIAAVTVLANGYFIYSSVVDFFYCFNTLEHAFEGIFFCHFYADANVVYNYCDIVVNRLWFTYTLLPIQSLRLVILEVGLCKAAYCSWRPSSQVLSQLSGRLVGCNYCLRFVDDSR